MFVFNSKDTVVDPSNSCKLQEQIDMGSQATSRTTMLSSNASYRAGQRRLRTENLNDPLIKAMPDELIDILVKYGNNSDGIPTILYASKMGDLKAVNLLIEHGADPFTRDSAKNTALHFALLSKNAQLVEFFLNKGLDPNASAFNNSHNGEVWQQAVALNDTKSFELLIAHGLRLDSAFYYHPLNCPSIACISAGSLDLLKLILSKGGDIPREGVFGLNQDPVLWAISSDCPGKGKEKVECLKWLISTRILNLHNAKDFDISNSYPEFVEYLLDNQYITINQKFHNNQYPLIHVAFHKPDILRLVIRNGADINARGPHGCTKLHDAATVQGPTEDYLESIRILLKNGADVNAKDDMGRTPLSRAQDPRVRKLLIEYGAV